MQVVQGIQVVHGIKTMQVDNTTKAKSSANQLLSFFTPKQ